MFLFESFNHKYNGQKYKNNGVCEMTNNNEFMFFCKNEDADLNFLQHLFIESGIETSIDTNHKEGQMGGEEILLAIIDSSLIPTVITVIGIWLSNRKKELIIEDKINKKKIHLISKNGKSFSSKEVEDLKNFFNNK